MNQEKNQSSDIIFYSSPEGNVRVEVVYSGETFWLTQKRMAELFGVEVPAISKHLKNIFETSELQEDTVISKMETTAADGKNYLTAFYNLDAIIAVGYRVNSREATQFSKNPKTLPVKAGHKSCKSYNPVNPNLIRPIIFPQSPFGSNQDQQ